MTKLWFILWFGWNWLWAPLQTEKRCWQSWPSYFGLLLLMRKSYFTW